MVSERETVSIRDLRNRGGWVVERVEAGEMFAVTRDGHPVAMLSPLPAPRLSTRELIRRRRNLEPIGLDALRSDLDAVIDPAL